MKKIVMSAVLFCLLGPAVSGAQAAVDAKLAERLQLSASAFKELMGSPDSKVPQSLLKDAEAVVIFPRTLNLAWGIGGQYGKGVAFKHHKSSSSWSAPAFYTIGGLTLGPQIGGQAIDIVLVVQNEKGFESLLKSKCTLGGDAGIAVGPAGRNATINTDLRLRSEIYSYSRAKGLYVGLSLKGAVVTPDNDANASYYGKTIQAGEIFDKIRGPYRTEDRELAGLLGGYSSDLAFKLAVLLIAGIVAAAAAFYFFSKR